MANSASAKKRARQTKTRTMRNRTRKERLKKAVKRFESTLATGDEAKIKEGLQAIQKAVDKAGTKGVLHKNAAARRKARFSKAATRALAG